MAKIVWSIPAVSQLEQILEYIALDKPQVATQVARSIFSTTDLFENFVRLGRPVPELPNALYRQLWIRPCMIYYRIDNDTVIILHVRRGEQPLDKQLLFD